VYALLVCDFVRVYHSVNSEVSFLVSVWIGNVNCVYRRQRKQVVVKSKEHFNSVFLNSDKKIQRVAVLTDEHKYW